MKIKMAAIVLLAGFISLNANAGFEQFNDVDGAIGVWDSAGTGYLSTITPFGLADVRSITTNNLTFELLPNINLYGDGSDPYWANGANGAKVLEGLTLWAMAPGTDHELTADIDYVQFDFNVDAYSLDRAYSMVAFVKVLDSIGETYSELVIDSVPITQLGAFQLSINPTAVMAGQLLQVGWYLRGPNVSPANSNAYGSATITVTGLFALSAAQ